MIRFLTNNWDHNIFFPMNRPFIKFHKGANGVLGFRFLWIAYLRLNRLGFEYEREGLE